MRPIWILTALLTVFGVPISAVAQDFEHQKEALVVIRDFSNSICASPPLEQSNQQINLSGSAKAKLAGLLGKITDIGIDGAAQYSDSASRGVLQSDLAQSIKNGNECRLSVFEKLVDKLLPANTLRSTTQISSLPTHFNKPSGYFIKQGSSWIEYPAFAPNQNFIFSDYGSDDKYEYLIDRSRSKPNDPNNAMIVRLPIRGGPAQWSYENPLQWTDFTIVSPN